MTTLFTIGHSSSSLRDIVDVLDRHGIDILIDVRSKPQSRTQHFDYGPFRAAIEATGIGYRHLGDRLGGIPRDPSIASRWSSGRLDPVVLAHLRSTDEWFDGIAELANLIRGGRSLCLMCAEADPDQCHRKAIALDLANWMPGIRITHIAVGKLPRQELALQEVIP